MSRSALTMRVLTVHNYYQQPGGEDSVFEAEARILLEHGHAVQRYIDRNERIGTSGRLQFALDTVWSRGSHAALARLVASFKPDIAHFHNTFPLVSPAAYYACQRAGVPVVQTLHNYRLGCPKATYYRANRVCEDCCGKALAWPGVVHACYQNSRSTTSVIAAMTAIHHVIGTWSSRVDAYIALSGFVRDKLIQNGLPSDKIVVKGNFLDRDPGVGTHKGGFFLFAGRLVAEKGIRLLLAAWNRLPDPPPLKIVGSGPLAGWVDEVTRDSPGIEWLGHQPTAEVHRLMGEALALVVPSEWYEPFGLVAIEAFATGTPVIAACIGALPEIVEHGHTGLLHTAADADALAAQVTFAAQHRTELAKMGGQARRSYEQRYTREQNYRALLSIYEQVLAAT